METKKIKKMSDVTVRRKRTVSKTAKEKKKEALLESTVPLAEDIFIEPVEQNTSTEGIRIVINNDIPEEPVEEKIEEPKEIAVEETTSITFAQEDKSKISKEKKQKAPNKFLNSFKKVSFTFPSFKKKDSIDKTKKIVLKTSKTKSTNKFLNSLKSISFTRLSIKEQTFFVKRLSFLIKAGVPMHESLVMIRGQTRRKGYASILDTVIMNISNGQNLSTSLSRFKNIFGEFAINIIGFGEESGILSQNLEYIADELKKRQALRKKIISASVYPIIVTIATIGIVTFLMVFLFPKILPIFASLKYGLPLSTRIVIAISNFISHFGFITMIILIVVGIAFSITLKKVKIVRFYFQKFLLKIPIIGKIIRDYNLANFTRTMGLLLRSGITMGEALPISAKTTPNLVYKEEFKMLSIVVNRGEQISTHLNKSRDLFPDLVSQIISVGENSGNLSNSLMYLSEMYEAEIDDFTKNLSSMVEPILMIVMGILVGFIAISIITPIYGITQQLQVK